MQLLHDPGALADSYRNASPFPHIVLDGLFDENYMEMIRQRFPTKDAEIWQRFKNDNEVKLGFAGEHLLDFELQAFMFLMNSRIALQFLEVLTGIDGLIPDPYFGGGGPHQIEPGGFLKVHTDFNVHPKMRIHRRINALVYLNRDWDESFGGHLELWSRDCSTLEKKVLPVFNRTVIFNTDESSWHGHPHPLTCPEDRVRQSVSFYYYTSTRADSELADEHATIFREVPKA